MAELDPLTDAARSLAGSSDESKLATLRKLLYLSGPWNGYRAFAYDHSDPDGGCLPNKLLHNYLRRRLGQCVSMPILFLILADRLGLRVSLVSAPEHVLVRHIDANGRAINFEATSGGHPARDEWLRQCFRISDRAIASGLHLRTLTKRESVALMAATVAEHLREARRYEELIAVCDAILEHDPRAGVVMVIQGSAYGALLQREFEQKYPNPFLIPEHLRARRLFLIGRNSSLIEAAERLGWEPWKQ